MLEHSSILYLIQVGFVAGRLDEATSWLVLLLAFTLATAAWTWVEARNRRRSVVCWVGLALMVPLLPLLLLWLLPGKDGE